MTQEIQKNTVVLFKGKSYPDDSLRDQRRTAIIPNALIAIAAPLRDAGWRVEIVDQHDPVEKVYAALKPILGRAVCVGISALTGHEIAEGLRLSRLIKESHPELPIIWGGWHVSILPDESIKSACVDIVVRGLGQIVFPKLVNALANGQDLAGIPGVLFKKDSRVIRTQEDKSAGLADVPLPAFDLLDLDFYREQSLMLRRKPVINQIPITGYLYYVTSFGCPCQCAFCCNDVLFQRRSYAYPVEKVVDQLKWLVEEKGFNSIGLIDANFFVNIERVKRFCQLIIEKKIPFVWDAQMHVDDILRYEKKGVLKLLKDSGCYRVNVGSESGSQEILDYIRKNITVEQTIESARLLKKYDIEAAYNFLFRLPKVEEHRHLNESFRLAQALKEIDPEISLPVSFYVPFPGTPMYRDALARGLQMPDTLEGWGDFDSNYDRASRQSFAWRSAEREDLITRVMMFYIPLAVPGNMHRGTLVRVRDKMKTSKFRVFIWAGHWLAKLRLKYAFFGFPFEIGIYKFFHNLRGGQEYVPGGKCDVGKPAESD